MLLKEGKEVTAPSALVAFELTAGIEKREAFMTVAEGAFRKMLALHRQPRLLSDYLQEIELFLYPFKVVIRGQLFGLSILSVICHPGVSGILLHLLPPAATSLSSGLFTIEGDCITCR